MKNLKTRAFVGSLVILSLLLQLSPMAIPFANAAQGVPSSTVTNSKTYYIRNVLSGLYLDATNNGNNGASIVQNPFNGGNTQRWTVHTYFNGHVLYPASQSLQHVINIYGGSTNDGTPIRIFNDTNGYDTGSLWTFQNRGGNKFSINSTHAGGKGG